MSDEPMTPPPIAPMVVTPYTPYDLKDNVWTIRNTEPSSETSWLTFHPSGLAINPVTGEVKIPPDLPIDTVAKIFWNGVARVVGQPEPFPETAPPPVAATTNTGAT